MALQPLYGARDLRQLDRDGGHFARHMTGMTDEQLFEKGAIAAELAYRDHKIQKLKDMAQKDHAPMCPSHPANSKKETAAEVSGIVCNCGANIWNRVVDEL